MKKIIFILILSLNLVIYGNTINRKQLQERDGFKYEVNQSKPYTGSVISYYENGQMDVKRNYKDGVLEGESFMYYKSGQTIFKINFKDGKAEGETIGYYENGQIKTKENYKDGKLEGEFINYYENGQIDVKGNYKDGVIIN